MSVDIIRGDALALPLADDSVDLVVTSPPYFGLRSYQDGGEHYSGQLGSEPTPAEFVAALIAATREMVRVVKPSGSIWVNLGDKYAERTGPARAGSIDDDQTVKRPAFRPPRGLRGNVQPKSLIGIPWRYALACIDDLGLILRAEVIWSKPNGLPESVTDRVRRSHEQWFHFVQRPRYYSAVDEIREVTTARKGEMSWAERKAAGEPSRRGEQGANDATVNGMAANPLGKLPGSVWTIPTQPLTVPASLGVDHFAAFPMEWPRRIIRGWSPTGVCEACREGRWPVVDRERAVGMDVSGGIWSKAGRHSNITGRQHGEHSLHTVTGYACACPDTTAPTTPGTVLDPFGGTGTTALVAHANGRRGISVDMSADYCRLAAWRTSDPGQIAAAMQVEKPAAQVSGQADLFEGIA